MVIVLTAILFAPVMAVGELRSPLSAAIRLMNQYPGNTGNPQYPQYPEPTYPGQATPPTYPGDPLWPGNSYQNSDQLFNSGRQLYNQAAYSSAIQTLRSFITYYPYEYRTAEACYLVADSYLRLNDFGNALMYFRRVSAQFSYHSYAERATYFIAYCLVKLYDYQGSVNEFRNFTLRYPQSDLADDAWYVSGLIYEKLANLNYAVAAFQKVVNEFPASNYYQQARERLLAIQGATVTPQYPFPTNPDQPLPPASNTQSLLSDYDLYNRGHSQLAAGKFNNAATWFNELLKRYPSSEFADDASFWRADARLQQKDYLQAVSLFGGFVRDFPASPYHAEAIYNLARAQKEHGRINYANQSYLIQGAGNFAWYQHQYPREKNAAEAIFQAGECYEILGDYGSAKSYYQQAINLYPYSAAATKAREKISGRY